MEDDGSQSYSNNDVNIPGKQETLSKKNDERVVNFADDLKIV